MARVLIIGGWNENYEAALSLGCEVIGFAASTERDLIHAKTLSKCNFYDVSSTNIPLCLFTAKAIHRQSPLDAVFSFSEKSLETAAVIATALGILGNELDGNVVTRNKYLTRQALSGTYLDNVKWRACCTLQDARDFTATAGFPIIVKPIDGAGSEDVYFIEESERLEEKVSEAILSGKTPLLAEEYIEGPEYSVETISLSGVHTVLAITQKTLTENFVEMQHQMPAPISDDEEQLLHSATKTLLEAVGVKNGIGHSEFRVRRRTSDSLEVYVIETQLRPGGGRIWKLVEICRGVNLFRALIGHVLGLEPLQSLTRPRFCLAYLPRFPIGTVTRISGLEEVKSSPGVELVDLELEIGKKTKSYANSANRNGVILVSGDSFEELIARRDAAVAHLGVDIA